MKNVNFGSKHALAPGISSCFLDNNELIMVKHIIAHDPVPVANMPVRYLPDDFVCEYCKEGKHHRCFIKRCSCAHKNKG